MGQGYVAPLYRQPLFQTMIGYGTVQCPFRCPHYGGDADYREGLCPNAEDAHFNRLITHEMMRPPMTHADLDDVAAAFHKVAESRHLLSDRAGVEARETAKQSIRANHLVDRRCLQPRSGATQQLIALLEALRSEPAPG